MTLLIVSNFRFGERGYRRGQLVEVQDRGLALTLVYGRKAVPGDLEARHALLALQGAGR